MEKSLANISLPDVTRIWNDPQLPRSMMNNTWRDFVQEVKKTSDTLIKGYMDNLEAADDTHEGLRYITCHLQTIKIHMDDQTKRDSARGNFNRYARELNALLEDHRLGVRVFEHVLSEFRRKQRENVGEQFLRAAYG